MLCCRKVFSGRIAPGPRPIAAGQRNKFALYCRSVGMDAWSPDQLKKMQLGGNEPMNTFFAKYGVSKTTDIKEKYNSTAAEVSISVS